MTQLLPEPDFIEYNPKTIEEAVFASWDELIDGVDGVGPLTPGTAEYIFAKLIAYREALVRLGIQEASKQNLLRFARFPMIDYIGELVGVERLPAQVAETTLQFSIPAAQGTDTLIAEGTRRKSKDGQVVFETTEDVYILAGNTTATVKAVCTEAGTQGNGYAAGQISEEVDPVPLGGAATNTVETFNGSPRESDARLLDRILLAPDAFTTAGSEASYRYHALTASAAVADVAVLSTEDDPSLDPGEIQIVVLDQSGVPSGALLAVVEAALSGEKVRPLSDTVEAVACTEVAWTLDVDLVLYADADDTETLAAAQEAAQAYADARQAKLSGALKHQAIRSALGVYGVYDMTINSPAEDELDADEWAHCTSVTVTVDSHTTYKIGE